MTIKDIKIQEFDYPLPDSLIARHPLEQRDSCRLLVSDSHGQLLHKHFSDIPDLLSPDTLIVANETKVINARMEFFKSTGSRIEIFLLEPLQPADYAISFARTAICSWNCLVGNRKRWKEGSLEKRLSLSLPDGSVEHTTLRAYLGAALEGNSYEVNFEWDNPLFSFASVVEAAGNIPIPPYLNRKSEESDTADYQTVYSRVQGSVAAPTAGLHFTPQLLDTLREKGIDMEKVTLHVGAGTFQPVKSDTIGEHPMHTETIIVSRRLITSLISALQNGKNILAVGTTSVRTLESLPWLGEMLKLKNASSLSSSDPQKELPLTVEQWMPYSNMADFDTLSVLETILEEMDKNDTDEFQAATSIMIAPGYRWRIVDQMITNFHQPKSTLLLLVSSFLNPNADSTADLTQWKKVYNEALSGNYRFLSYGDACLFSPSTPKS